MERIDITITGGVFGLTERRIADPTSLDPETIRLMAAAFRSGLIGTVPSADDPARDARTVSIVTGGAAMVFPEHRAPPFWDGLRRNSNRRGG